MKIRVPGNLLLCGEYTITLEGGRGIALALEPAVEIALRPSETTEIHALFQGQRICWRAGDESTPPPLIDILMRALPLPSPHAIRLDSSPHCDPSGRKYGYGSSAAITVGWVYAALTLRLGRLPTAAELLPLAHRLHREFQGGRGSGYDIACSYWGGAGIFTGGEPFKWEPLLLPWINRLSILRGTSSCCSSGEVKLFKVFLQSAPGRREKLLAVANALCEALAAAESPERVALLFRRLSALNIWINRQLHRDFSAPAYALPTKFLGAGAELIAELWPTSAPTPLPLSKRGVHCEL